jgi:hypothetical protein
MSPDSERDDFADLPALARFGAQLDQAARRADAPRRRLSLRVGRQREEAARRAGVPRRTRSLRVGRQFEDAARRAAVPRRPRSWRVVGLSLLALVGVTATAAATVAALRSTVISAPDPKVVPAEQTPVAGSTVVMTPRSADPQGGPPWALRLTRSETGQTCTTVGQVRDGIFGIVGLDGVFRQLPPAIADACGRGLLLGSRIVAGPTPQATRSIVYGVAGTSTQRATLVTASGASTLKLGARGTFVAALRGYPEDSAASVELTGPGGRVTRHALGAQPGIVPDIAGAPAWRLDRYTLGTRRYCAHLSDARGPLTQVITASSVTGGRASTPVVCVARRDRFAWAADAFGLRPGQHGTSGGFSRWDYVRRPARTVLLGVARAPGAIARVTVKGAGAPRRLTPAPNGTFALLLPATVSPRDLRLTVVLHDGTTQHGQPGHGVAPDLTVTHRVVKKRVVVRKPG